MLIKLSPSENIKPIIRKSINGKDCPERSSFSCGTDVTFTVEAPRMLGASAVVLRIARDEEGDVDFPLEFVSTQQGTDTYALTLKLSELCGTEESGLFYYEFLFLRGVHTLFTDTANFVD